MPPSSHGRSGFTTIRTAADLSHNRRGIPSHGVSTQPRCRWAAVTGSGPAGDRELVPDVERIMAGLADELAILQKTQAAG
jgi:hypothetical protein